MLNILPKKLFFSHAHGDLWHFSHVALSGVTIGVACWFAQSELTGHAANVIGTVNAKAQNVVVAPNTNFLLIVIFPPFMVLLICFLN